MKADRLALVLLAAVAAVSAASAQEFVLEKDGRTVPFTTFRRVGKNIMVPSQLAGGAKAEIGYPVDGIARIEAPEPPEIKEAAGLVAGNKAAQAIAKVNPVVTLYAPVREVEGEWWSAAAMVKAAALAQQGGAAEAEALYREVAAGKSASAPLAALKMLAFRSKKGDAAAALKDLEKMEAQLAATKDDAVMAEVLLQKGNALLALREFRKGLEAYVSVVVFHPRAEQFQAAATLGAARCAFGLDDLTRARLYLGDLKANYASSPEMEAAQPDFARLERVDRPARKPGAAAQDAKDAKDQPEKVADESKPAA